MFLKQFLATPGFESRRNVEYLNLNKFQKVSVLPCKITTEQSIFYKNGDLK